MLIPLLFAVTSLATQALPGQRTLTVAEARADVDTLRQALEEAHGGLYRFVPQSELRERFAQIRRRITHPVSQYEFIGLAEEMIALIHDGHSRFDLDSATAAELAAAPIFPLRVALEGSRLLVAADNSPTDSAVRPGMEILRINGRPVADILRVMLARTAGDGFIETGKRRRVSRTFAQQLYLIDRSSAFDLILRDTSGDEFAFRAPAVLAPPRPAAPRNVELHFLDRTTAALRVTAFEGDDFVARLDSAFTVARDSGVKTLCLDLRGNGGGADEYGSALVARLVDHLFRYFDHIHLTTIHPSFATWLPRTYDNLRAGTRPDSAGGYLVTETLHPGVAEQVSAQQPFLGRLYVLIDGGTFSTAADVVAVLRQLGRATFIGEETGGTAEGNTSGLNALIRLPHSGLRFKVYLYGYWNAVDAPRGRGTVPDVFAPSRVADILRGRDVALDTARALAARSDPP